MVQYKLTREIVARSAADHWDRAKLEWALVEVYEAEEPQTCLCGHFPIIEVCVLENRMNGETAEVGNHCVKKFLGLPSDVLFQVAKRVRKDEQRSLSPPMIDHAHTRRWISDWEREFYLDVWRKRKLTERQLRKKIEVNRKVLRKMRRG